MTNSVIFDESGYYELHLEKVTTYNIQVNENVQVEISMIVEEECTSTIQLQLQNSAKLAFLLKNKSNKSQITIESKQLQDSQLRLGLLELEDHHVDVVARCHLLEAGAEALVVSTSISENHKYFDIECIHHAPHTSSDMKNFNISRKGANYKMRCCGTIVKGAYQSKSHQISRILTTSDDQRSEAIPLLLIDENDVEASHANSMGKMDENHVYYMLSRGLDDEQARSLLMLSYLLPISEVLSNESVNESIKQEVRSLAGL